MLRLNGRPVEGPAPFDLADRGLTLGDGLFETIALFGGRPALLGAHLDRLQAAAAEIRLPVDRAFCEAEVLTLAEQAGESDCVIRLTVTRGAGARGLALPEQATPTVIAASSPYPKGALNAPMRLATVSVRRNPASFASRAKTLSYLDSVLAFDEARRLGADDALMLNTDGRVASTAMANLFALVGDDLVTPPVSEGVLPGVVRGFLLQAAPGAGLSFVERPLDIETFDRADAVFATNSVRLVMPVTMVDGVRRGTPDAVARLAARVARELTGG
ncbi:aminotransferase class IV [Methylopila sp. M107]|uniref:aminotransferase class IV n=1 Tax=Methylopila sp. M107 TaxID=1101190 RepID=UPI0003623B15|nr:aminotransferase class IV [Methylopila sp. M107]